MRKVLYSYLAVFAIVLSLFGARVAYTSSSMPVNMGGDIGGTSDNSTVNKVKGTTVNTAGGALVTGSVLRATGVSTIDYGAVDLSNSSAVTGTLAASHLPSIALTGDVSCSGASGSLSSCNVTAVSGSSPIAVTPNSLQWINTASPLLTQASESTTTAAGDFQITPQQSTHATDETGGNLTVNLQAPTGAGTEAFFRLKRGATEMWRLGSINGSLAGLWLVQSSPSTSNYAIQASANDTYLNGVNGTHLLLNNSEKILINSSGVNIAVPIGGDNNFPLQHQATSGALSTATNITLSNAQKMTPVIQLNGTTQSGETVTLPNTVGGTWYFDFTGVTLSTNSVTFTTGSGTSAVITSALLIGGKELVTCIVVASNFVSCG